MVNPPRPLNGLKLKDIYSKVGFKALGVSSPFT
jgi:hypothetical protein